MGDRRGPESEVLVAASGVRRVFEPGQQGVTSANFAIEAGTSVAVVGPSGSGKTTLLTLLGMLAPPDAGDLRILGHDALTARPGTSTALRRSEISFIFQAFHLVPHLTVLENIQLGLNHHDATMHQRRALAEEQLDNLGLADHASALPKTLSGGEQQRVAIARALIRRPRLLLCDEPTGNLDSANGETVVSALLSSVRDDSAVVIVTHDERLAARCDRQINVLDGRAEGAP